MAHYSRLSKVVIDVPPAGHDRELAFWSAAVGLPLTRFERHPEYHGAALHGQEFWLLVQRLDQGPARVQQAGGQEGHKARWKATSCPDQFPDSYANPQARHNA
jgi:hypothetical protein